MLPARESAHGNTPALEERLCRRQDPKMPDGSI